MRALDDTFADRVRETTLGLGGVIFLALLCSGDPRIPVGFAVGLASALLIWRAAQRVGGALQRDQWRARDIAWLAGIYLGKYGLIGAAIWVLWRYQWLSPEAFTGGFLIPTVVVALKAVGWMVLPPSVDPAPVYSRDRKVGPRG